MEIEKIYPKPHKVVIAKSTALFSFKNCPDERIISRKIEIPEISAKW